MGIVVLILGLIFGVAAESWIPFAISVVIAAIIQWVKDDWLHQHIHGTINDDHIWEDEHGDKTIE